MSEVDNRLSLTDTRETSFADAVDLDCRASNLQETPFLQRHVIQSEVVKFAVNFAVQKPLIGILSTMSLTFPSRRISRVFHDVDTDRSEDLRRQEA